MTDIANGVKHWKLMKAPKEHWSGIKQYDYTAMTIQPFMSSKTKRLITGLTKDDEARLEKELGLEKGDLSPNSQYWAEYMIKVNADVLRLDLSIPEDELQFLFLKANKLVAFGHGELKRNSNAKYVLFNDVDQAIATNKKQDIKIDAYARLKTMTTDEMIDVLMVMGKPIVSFDPNIIKAMMGKVVEKEGEAFLKIADDDNFKMKLFVLKCIHYDILTRSRGRTIDEAVISYGEEFLGEGLDQVVKILNRQNNQKLYMALEKRLDLAVSAGTLAGTPIMTGYQVEKEIVAQEEAAPKRTKSRKLGSNAAKGTKRDRFDGKEAIKDAAGAVTEVLEDGNDSGDFLDDAPEMI